jgi:hypothetical protein
MRTSLLPLLMAGLLVSAAACRDAASPVGQSSERRANAEGDEAPVLANVPGEWFTDEAAAMGLDFVHDNGMTGGFYQTEIMTPGVALFDYDNDGDLDAYLVQGGRLGTGTPLIPPPANVPTGDRLYRNDLVDNGDGMRTPHFTDVTVESGIEARGYGMGVAVGDIDNDGWSDLYLTGFGRNQMFRNNGDGSFTDVSTPSGTDDPGSWGVSASFFDFDRDGWLDLFVGNYLAYSLSTDIPCFSASGVRDYCRPSAYRAQPNRLYRNLGGGRFADRTIAAGLARDFGPALGASSADFNGDGWIDLFVANDEQENQLWINQRDGTFVNTALLAGAALGPNGERKANMGVDAGDFDNDGDADLFVTELVAQGSSLYVNDGSGVFEEQSIRAGIRRPTLPFTGFGTAWIDFDNDGWLDVLSVNGDVNRNVADLAGGENPFPLGQRKLLLRNAGGHFEDVTDRAGRVFSIVEASRGAAFGDIDNDGDTDVLVGNGAGRPRLLVNHVGSRQHWLGLRLMNASSATTQGTTVVGGGRDLVGARVAVIRPGTTLWRHARADGSYASSNDPRVLVGLGSSTDPPTVQVIWPDGQSETWPDVAIDRYTTLVQGTSP